MFSFQMFSFNPFIKMGRDDGYKILVDEDDNTAHIEVSNQDSLVLSARLEFFKFKFKIKVDTPKRLASSREHWDDKLGDAMAIADCSCPFCTLHPPKKDRRSSFSMTSPLDWMTSHRRRSRPFSRDTSSPDTNSFF